MTVTLGSRPDKPALRWPPCQLPASLGGMCTANTLGWLKKEGCFVLSASQLESTVYLVGEDMRQEHEATGHTAAVGRTQREMNAGDQLDLCSASPQRRGWYGPVSGSSLLNEPLHV